MSNRPGFFYKLIFGKHISDLGSGDEKKKALKMTSSLVIFRAFFLISPEKKPQ